MKTCHKACYGEILLGFVVCLGFLWLVLHRYISFWDITVIDMVLFIIVLGIRRWFETIYELSWWLD